MRYPNISAAVFVVLQLAGLSEQVALGDSFNYDNHRTGQNTGGIAEVKEPDTPEWWELMKAPKADTLIPLSIDAHNNRSLVMDDATKIFSLTNRIKTPLITGGILGLGNDGEYTFENLYLHEHHLPSTDTNGGNKCSLESILDGTCHPAEVHLVYHKKDAQGAVTNSAYIAIPLAKGDGGSDLIEALIYDTGSQLKALFPENASYYQYRDGNANSWTVFSDPIATITDKEFGRLPFAVTSHPIVRQSRSHKSHPVLHFRTSLRDGSHIRGTGNDVDCKGCWIDGDNDVRGEHICVLGNENFAEGKALYVDGRGWDGSEPPNRNSAPKGSSGSVTFGDNNSGFQADVVYGPVSGMYFGPGGSSFSANVSNTSRSGPRTLGSYSTFGKGNKGVQVGQLYGTMSGMHFGPGGFSVDATAATSEPQCMNKRNNCVKGHDNVCVGGGNTIEGNKNRVIESSFCKATGDDNHFKSGSYKCEATGQKNTFEEGCRYCEAHASNNTFKKRCSNCKAHASDNTFEEGCSNCEAYASNNIFEEGSSNCKAYASNNIFEEGCNNCVAYGNNNTFEEGCRNRTAYGNDETIKCN